MSLHGKRAVVAGSTSGIGRAVAERLAKAGAEVIITGRNEQRGRDVVSAIESAGGRASLIGADLSNLDDVRRLADRVGDVDVLVNSAGAFPAGSTADTDEEAFDLAFDINVKAPFFLTGAIAPGMASNGGGAIINVSTMVANIGMAGLAAYGASKAAIELLTKAWTDEYGPHGVRLNAVAPGPTRTPASESMGEGFDQLASTLPAGHAARPDEIAAAVAFLVSEQASFIYGAVLPADGGRVAV